MYPPFALGCQRAAVEGAAAFAENRRQEMIDMKRTTALALVALLMACTCLHAQAAQPQPAGKAAAAAPNLQGIRAARDIKYGEAPGKANLLDIYVPEDAQGALPLIVWIHGGGWEGGDKGGCPALSMVRRGYVAASINYRFSREAIFPAQIEDCKGAIRWLRTHAREYHIDPDRIGVWGSSAGGHLVALLGTSGGVKEIEGTTGGNLDQSSRVQAVCDWFGPTDMSVFFQQAGAENIFKPAPEKSPLYRLFGGPTDQHKDLVAKANPLTFITKNDPPFLIMHGDMDTLVPLAQSQMLADALKAAGVECHLEVIAGAGHGNGFNKPEVNKMIAEFFDKTLRASH
jgi:acetyl esterase/lipase